MSSTGRPVSIALLGGSISQKEFVTPVPEFNVPPDTTWHAIVHRSVLEGLYRAPVGAYPCPRRSVASHLELARVLGLPCCRCICFCNCFCTRVCIGQWPEPCARVLLAAPLVQSLHHLSDLMQTPRWEVRDSDGTLRQRHCNTFLRICKSCRAGFQHLSNVAMGGRSVAPLESAKWSAIPIHFRPENRH
eukprot:366432-Chlamydomonas_euryale.AAC.2